jgi:hypothetical protein
MQRAADFTEDQHYTDKRWNSSPRLMRERYTAEARACLEAALAGEPK